MPTPDSIFEQIDTALEGANSYREAIVLLKSLPPGYLQCFAFQNVDSDICNGGISQLHSNSTWALMPFAVTACDTAQADSLSLLLREIILYYHQRGRSKLKRHIGDDYFSGVPQLMEKTLDQLEDEYFELESARRQVVEQICNLEAGELWNGT